MFVGLVGVTVTIHNASYPPPGTSMPPPSALTLGHPRNSIPVIVNGMFTMCLVMQYSRHFHAYMWRAEAQLLLFCMLFVQNWRPSDAVFASQALL